MLDTLTITSITAFERMRGYREAIRHGKPHERQMLAFEVLLTSCVVLPFDEEAARVAAMLWAGTTRSRRDFAGLDTRAGAVLPLLDWSRPPRGRTHS